MVTKARSYKAADIGSHHYLLLSEWRLKIQRQKLERKPEMNTEALIYDKQLRIEFDIQLKTRFEALTEIQSSSQEFKSLKECICEVGKEILKSTKRTQKSWLSEKSK